MMQKNPLILVEYVIQEKTWSVFKCDYIKNFGKPEKSLNVSWRRSRVDLELKKQQGY